MAIDHFMKNALATCGFPEYYAYILKDAGINVIQQLLAKHISFPTQATPIDHGGVREVLQTLHAIPIRGYSPRYRAGMAPVIRGHARLTRASQGTISGRGAGRDRTGPESPMDDITIVQAQ